jgi:hypothetical protein
MSDGYNIQISLDAASSSSGKMHKLKIRIDRRSVNALPFGEYKSLTFYLSKFPIERDVMATTKQIYVSPFPREALLPKGGLEKLNKNGFLEFVVDMSEFRWADAVSSSWNLGPLKDIEPGGYFLYVMFERDPVRFPYQEGAICSNEVSVTQESML